PQSPRAAPSLHFSSPACLARANPSWRPPAGRRARTKKLLSNFFAYSSSRGILPHLCLRIERGPPSLVRKGVETLSPARHPGPERGILANRPVLGRTRAGNAKPPHLRDSVRFGKVRDTHRFAVDLYLRPVKGPTSHLIPFTPRVPLWRCEVFNTLVHRSLWLALAAAAVLTAAGCSKTATDAHNAAKETDPAKPAAVAKPAV